MATFGYALKAMAKHGDVHRDTRSTAWVQIGSEVIERAMKRNGQPTKREIEIAIARRAGYERDGAAYARILVERRCASYDAIKSAYRQGYIAREAEHG